MSFSETDQPAPIRDSNPNVDPALVARVPDPERFEASQEAPNALGNFTAHELDAFVMADPFANDSPVFAAPVATPEPVAAETTQQPQEPLPIPPVEVAPLEFDVAFTPAPVPVYALSDLYGVEPSEPAPTYPAPEPALTEAAPIEPAPVYAAAPIEPAPIYAAAPVEPEPAPAPIEPAPVYAAAPIETAPVGEVAPAAESVSPGVFERYQKLIGDPEAAHESAILAAVDSAILGAPASGALAAAMGRTVETAETTTHEAVSAQMPAQNPAFELPPARPRMPSFDLERDIDWSEEAAAANASRAVSAESSTTPISSTVAHGRVSPASDAPVALDREAPKPAAIRNARETAAKSKPARSSAPTNKSDSPGWSAFLGGLFCALVVGFGLGFVMGRDGSGATRATAASTPEDTKASVGEARAQAAAAQHRVEAVVNSAVTELAPAEPLLPGPETELAANPANTPGPAADAPAAPAVAAAAAAATPQAPATGVPSGAVSAPAKLPNMEFDSKSALAALGKAATRAGVCVPPGEPGGSIVATVTFSPSGRASSAGLSGAQFSGTYSSECIKNILSEVKVRPFVGEAVTVRKTLAIR
ncbi:MAG: hypothetical protein ACOY0T_20900 [Myxococcota bacterium]